MLPFVQRTATARGSPTFSLLELGSWSGLYALEVSSHFPRSTVVVLEPNRSVLEEHATLARAWQRSNVIFAHNPVTDEVAEALAHSNEFLDAQLLLSLHTARPFDHGVTVSSDRLEKLDKFVGHLLTLARRSLLLLPAPRAPRACRDNRLYNWAHASATASSADKAIPARLHAAGKTFGLRLSLAHRLRGLAADGCEYEVWEVALLHMDRVNRHHFCIGGCKTHTRRTYRMIYDGAADPLEADGRMNMTNTQTGRRIPFETGSINMHSLLSLQGEPSGKDGVSAAEAARQALIVMFLSLPVFQVRVRMK